MGHLHTQLTRGARPDRSASPKRKRSCGAITPVAWHADDGIAFSDWVEVGCRLGIVGRSAGWWIGDWLSYGNAAYGERYVRASRITGYDVQTLMNMVYVASRFEISRRREKLSWSHHAEVAALDRGEQDKWLGRAEAERLSVRCMRQEMRCARRPDELGELAPSQPPAVGAAPPSPAAGHDRAAALVCPECGHSFSSDDQPRIEAGAPPPARRRPAPQAPVSVATAPA